MRFSFLAPNLHYYSKNNCEIGIWAINLVSNKLRSFEAEIWLCLLIHCFSLSPFSPPSKARVRQISKSNLSPASFHFNLHLFNCEWCWTSFYMFTSQSYFLFCKPSLYVKECSTSCGSFPPKVSKFQSDSWMFSCQNFICLCSQVISLFLFISAFHIWFLLRRLADSLVASFAHLRPHPPPPAS